MKSLKLILFSLLTFVSISANADHIKYDHVAFGYATRGILFTSVEDFIAVTYKVTNSSGQDEEYLRVLNNAGAIFKDRIRVQNHVNKISVFGQRIFVLGDGEISITDLLKNNTSIHRLTLNNEPLNVIRILPEIPTQRSDLYILFANQPIAGLTGVTTPVSVEISIGKQTDDYTLRHMASIDMGNINIKKEIMSASVLKYPDQFGFPVRQYFVTTRSTPIEGGEATYNIYSAKYTDEDRHVLPWVELENPAETNRPIRFLDQTNLQSTFVVLAEEGTSDRSKLFTYTEKVLNPIGSVANGNFMLYLTQNLGIFSIISGTNTLDAKFQQAGSGDGITHNFPSNSVVDDVSPIFLANSLDISRGTTPSVTPPSNSPNASFHMVQLAHAISVLRHVNDQYHVDIFSVYSSGSSPPLHELEVRLPMN